MTGRRSCCVITAVACGGRGERCLSFVWRLSRPLAVMVRGVTLGLLRQQVRAIRSVRASARIRSVQSELSVRAPGHMDTGRAAEADGRWFRSANDDQAVPFPAASQQLPQRRMNGEGPVKGPK